VMKTSTRTTLVVERRLISEQISVAVVRSPARSGPLSVIPYRSWPVSGGGRVVVVVVVVVDGHSAQWLSRRLQVSIRPRLELAGRRAAGLDLGPAPAVST
jgi:hypothetical protein